MRGKKPIVIKGDPMLTTARCSLETPTKTWEEDDQGFWIEFQNLEIEFEGDEVTNPTVLLSHQPFFIPRSMNLSSFDFFFFILFDIPLRLSHYRNLCFALFFPTCSLSDYKSSLLFRSVDGEFISGFFFVFFLLGLFFIFLV